MRNGASNAWEATAFVGADFFAASVGLTATHLSYDGDSTKELSQIKSLLATGNPECSVVVSLTNTNADAPGLVAAEKAVGGWISTQWNWPPDYLPSQQYERWFGVTFPNQNSGYAIATKLIDAMGGKGNIVALQGGLDAQAAKDRFTGLQKALSEHPDVKLLDQQTANWLQTEALTVTNAMLAKYPGQINGLWAANDAMGLGALSALKAAGLNGKIPIASIDGDAQALQAVQSGDFVVDMDDDAIVMTGLGLALGYCSATGQFDQSKLSASQGVFSAKDILVTKDNVASVVAAPKASDYLALWKCDNLLNQEFGH